MVAYRSCRTVKTGPNGLGEVRRAHSTSLQPIPQPHEPFNTYGNEGTMASAYYQLLKAALETLTTLDGQLQFLNTQTGVSDECVRRVLVHLNAQPVFGEEGDVEAQARHEGASVEQYAVAMCPLLERSIEQVQARLRELEREDPVLSEETLEKVREWEAMVGTIARLSGEGRELVITILSAVTALSNRQDDIVHELLALKVMRSKPAIVRRRPAA